MSLPKGSKPQGKGDSKVGYSLLITIGVILIAAMIPIIGIAPTCGGAFEYATIVGTDGDDVLEGTEGSDKIAGLKGNDIIYGKGGNDFLCGGDGDDIIYGGLGNDYIIGSHGSDKIFGEEGDDNLNGLGHGQREGDYDIVNGGPGDDYCNAGREPKSEEINCES